MKRLLLIFSALTIFVSCAKIETFSSSDEQKQRIIATFSADTKTYNRGVRTYWSDGDQMSVFYTKTTGRYGVSCFTYSSDNAFTGTVSSLGESDNNWFAFYPFDKNNTEVDDILLTVPKDQTQEGNSSTEHISGPADPLYGYARNVKNGSLPQLTMFHVLSKVKFHISNGESDPVTVTKITFKAPRDIAGEFTANISASRLNWSTYKSTRTVTLNVKNGEAIEKDYSADFSASILPISTEGEYVITVYANMGGKEVVSTKTADMRMDLDAGLTNTINYTFKVTGDTPGTPDTPDTPDQPTGSYYTKVSSEPSNWDGTYLVVDEAAGKAFAPFTDNASSYAVNVTISNGQIASDGVIDKYAITVSNAGQNHANSNVSGLRAYNVKNSNGQYIWWSSNFGEYDSARLIAANTNTATNSSTTYEYYHTFKYDGGVQMTSAIHTDSGNAYYLGYSGGSFSYNSSSSSSRVQLYKLNGEGGNTSGGGGSGESGSTIQGYQLLTSAPSDWSGSYLLVSTNKKYLFNGEKGSSSKKNVYNLQSSDMTGDVITNSSLSQYAFTISYSDGNYYFMKDGNYYYVDYDSNSSTGIVTTSSRSKAGWKYSGILSGGGFTFYQVSNNQNQYIYYKDSESTFKFGKSGETSGILLYKLNNGSSSSGTQETPTQSGAVFNLENDYLKQYLDAAESSYSNSTNTSIVSTYSGNNYARDLPNPVNLKWTGSATSLSVYEGTSANGTLVKKMEFSSSTSADIYNLIPGKTYYYTTSNGQNGTFSTTGRRRMIKVSDSEKDSHARNCRDLGGIKTRKGETIKYGLIFRGTNMDDVSSQEKDILLNELGIKLDQDLRNETNLSSSPLGSSVYFSHHGGYDASTIQNQNGDNMKQSVSDVLNYVIDGKPVYVHCRIGSDRTGHMIMLYLALLGCDLKECDIDYEITSFASKMTYGTRTIGSGNEASFRNKFTKGSYSVDKVPEAVEDYVVNTLGISISTVKAFRKAMGVSETL